MELGIGQSMPQQVTTASTVTNPITSQKTNPFLPKTVNRLDKPAWDNLLDTIAGETNTVYELPQETAEPEEQEAQTDYEIPEDAVALAQTETQETEDNADSDEWNFDTVNPETGERTTYFDNPFAINGYRPNLELIEEAEDMNV